MERQLILEKPRVCVKVEKEKRNLYQVVLSGQENIFLLKAGTALIPFKGEIVDAIGNPIPATGTYYRTAETIDPYHLVTDWF